MVVSEAPAPSPQEAAARGLFAYLDRLRQDGWRIDEEIATVTIQAAAGADGHNILLAGV
jgi:hypothetical protein